MSRKIKRLLKIGVLAGIPLTLLVLLLRPDLWRYYTDGFLIRQPGLNANLRLVLWEPPMPLMGKFPTNSDCYEPTISSDGKVLIFASGRAQKNADLFICYWNGSEWSEPKPLAKLNTQFDELGPELSRDGRLLFFYSNRPDGVGGYDIWVSRKTETDWEKPVCLSEPINSPYDEYDPALSPDGSKLVFSSNRPKNKPISPADKDRWRATLRQSPIENDFDLYLAFADGESTNHIPKFQSPQPFTICNSDGDDGQPAFSPRGEFLYFSSNRKGGFGGFDLYRSRCLDGTWLSPENLGAPINTVADEMDPAPYLEGYALVFSSNFKNPDKRQFALYSSFTREVVAQTDLSPIAGLLRFLKNWQWWLLALLLSLLALAWLLSQLLDVKYRQKLSLLQRCILASIALHILLALLLSLWVLSEAVYTAVTEKAMEVAIDEGALAREKIAIEIREQISQLPQPSQPAQIIDNIIEPISFPEIQPNPSQTEYIPPADPSRLFLVETPQPEEKTRTETKIQPATLKSENTLEKLVASYKPQIKMELPQQTSIEKPAEKKPITELPDILPKPQVAVAIKSPEKTEPEVNLKPVALEVSGIEIKRAKTEFDSRMRSPPTLTISNILNIPPIKQIVGMETPPDYKSNLLAKTAPEKMEQNRSESEIKFEPVREPISSAIGSGLKTESFSPLPMLPKPTSIVSLPESKLEENRVSLLKQPQTIARLTPDTKKIMPSIVFETRADKPLSPYLLRNPELRDKIIDQLGGSKETEEAVRRALDWFTRNQEKDGRWSIARFGGVKGHDIATTGFALLCYMGYGVRHDKPGQYHEPLSKGLKWLLEQVRENGKIFTPKNAPDEGGNMYDQGIAAIAIAEAYGITKDPALLKPLKSVVDFIVQAQNKQTGGWRYQPQDPGDTSVFGWQLMALKSAKMAGIDIPDEVFERANRWLDRVGGGKYGGLYGYQTKEPRPAMAAQGMFCRQLLGRPPTHPQMIETAQYLNAHLPSQDNINYYYWYYGCLALYQHQGNLWENWNQRIKPILLSMQKRGGDDDGSWNPVGERGNQFGRAVATAFATLSLEVYYRYLPLYNLTPPPVASSK
ncbi:MAG: hypothetical protein ACP5TE_09320 [Verrucomicrobiia bacterium]